LTAQGAFSGQDPEGLAHRKLEDSSAGHVPTAQTGLQVNLQMALAIVINFI